MLKGILNLFHLSCNSNKECNNSESLDTVIDSTNVNKSNKPASNAIKCVNPDTGAVYSSIAAAAKAEGISRSSARRLVAGEYESINGVRLNTL